MQHCDMMIMQKSAIMAERLGIPSRQSMRVRRLIDETFSGIEYACRRRKPVNHAPATSVAKSGDTSGSSRFIPRGIVPFAHLFMLYDVSAGAQFSP